VRTLAAEKKMTILMEWTLLVSGAVLALVCFLAPGTQQTGIYGYRMEPGWTGFGPFPNRNHTACFLAMSAVLGCGVISNAFRHKKHLLLAAAIVCEMLAVIAVLASQSRGGLIAGIIGLLVFLSLSIRKVNGRKALAVGVAVLLLTASTVLVFGGQVLQRFHSESEGGVSNHLRMMIWENALAMWRDAPLFGFGFGSFPQVFPLYQDLPLESQIVLHPESSWVLSLVEFGAVPVALMAAALIWFLTQHLRGDWRKARGFSLRASALAAATVLAVHSLWDVPGHRWATAGFGLAALAIALPLRRETALPRRSAMLLPLLAALFWMVGLHWMRPAWSPVAFETITDRQRAATRATLHEFQDEEKWFPLSSDLHYQIGLRLLQYRGQRDWAMRHFQIATRLKPSSWLLPANIAFACGSVSEDMAFYFWQLAIERAGHRRAEIFNLALQYCRGFASGSEFWQSYAAAHPDLLLSLVEQSGPKNARASFDQWWKSRAASNDLSEQELKLFAQIFREIGDPDRLRQWIKWHGDREPQDFRDWATMFHAWGDDAGAWQLLVRHVKEPEFPKASETIVLGALESRWVTRPDDFVNAQTLAARWNMLGETQRCETVVVSTAWLYGAPLWFLEKGAFMQFRAGKMNEAVALLLMAT